MLISNMIELGKKIKETRKQQGLTQSDLAISAKVGIRFIVDVENGKETAQIGKVLRICQMLGLKIDIN
ncbi:helix-turn-helix transcriptional regulator [bacterium]|nr:helix-turn-helix transcriptional regulator [bacterium]